MKLLAFISIATFTVLAAAGSSSQVCHQDSAQNSADDSIQKNKPAAAKDQKPAEEKKQEPAAGQGEKPPPGLVKHFKPMPLSLGFEWQDLDLSGNGHKFRQYASPPQGVALNGLRWYPPIGRVGYGLLTLKGQPDGDYRSDNIVSLAYGQTRGEGRIWRNLFFDPTPVVVPESDRGIQEVFLRQNVTPSFGLSARYKMDEQNTFREPPFSAFRQRTRYSDIVAEGKVGNGSLSLGLADWRYADRTQVQPDTKVQRLKLGYSWDVTKNANLEGAFTRHFIRQPGRASSQVDTYGLNGGLALGPSTDLDIALRRDQLTLPVVQNSYDRARRFGRALLIQKWPGWTAQMGFGIHESERVRGDQTFVDVPRWTTFDGRVYGRMGKQTRITLRASREDLVHPPQMMTDDPRSLFWDSRTQVQFKLQTGQPDLNGYLTASWRRMQNDARSVAVSSKTVSVGSNWQANPRVAAFVDFTFEGWEGQSEVTDFPTLSNFTPDGLTTNLGASWVIDNRTFFWLSWTTFSSSNENPLRLPNGNTRGDFVSISLRRQLPHGSEIGLVYAPWTYRDRISSQMDYDAHVLMLTANAKY